MIPEPAVITAWRAYALAVDGGDRQSIDYRWKAFEHALESSIPAPETTVISFDGVPETVQEFTFPIMDVFIRRHMADLREAFCILLTINDEELPLTWDGVETAFREWMNKELTRIDADVPAVLKAKWEKARADDSDDEDDDDSDYDWSDYSDDAPDEDDEESEKEE